MMENREKSEKKERKDGNFDPFLHSNRFDKERKGLSNRSRRSRKKRMILYGLTRDDFVKNRKIVDF